MRRQRLPPTIVTPRKNTTKKTSGSLAPLIGACQPAFLMMKMATQKTAVASTAARRAIQTQWHLANARLDVCPRGCSIRCVSRNKRNSSPNSSATTLLLLCCGKPRWTAMTSRQRHWVGSSCALTAATPAASRLATVPRRSADSTSAQELRHPRAGQGALTPERELATPRRHIDWRLGARRLESDPCRTDGNVGCRCLEPIVTVGFK